MGVGYCALLNKTTGDKNVAIGPGAGVNLINGNINNGNINNI